VAAFEPGVTALLVVDVQRDFCDDGSLPVPGGAEVAGAISDFLAGAWASRYRLVVATRDWHVDPGPHFAEPEREPDFRDSWPRHCVAGTIGAQWHPNLHLPEGAIVVSKGEREAAYSGFEGRDKHGRRLADILRNAAVAGVDIAGVATSYCVRATALDAARLGFATRVLETLVADVATADSAATFAELRARGVAMETTTGST
jgi:nicotinamidase/pyrazinamidase